jgi:hypothetical protein
VGGRDTAPAEGRMATAASSLTPTAHAAGALRRREGLGNERTPALGARRSDSARLDLDCLH